jgi:hypothetical protein
MLETFPTVSKSKTEQPIKNNTTGSFPTNKDNSLTNVSGQKSEQTERNPEFEKLLQRQISLMIADYKSGLTKVKTDLLEKRLEMYKKTTGADFVPEKDEDKNVLLEMMSNFSDKKNETDEKQSENRTAKLNEIQKVKSDLPRNYKNQDVVNLEINKQEDVMEKLEIEIKKVEAQIKALENRVAELLLQSGREQDIKTIDGVLNSKREMLKNLNKIKEDNRPKSGKNFEIF